MTYERTIECPATDGRGAVDARVYVMTADQWSKRTTDSTPTANG